MNTNPMTEQVARLVGNLLAGGETICLPGVGSLRVERQPARRIDRRHVVPPCRTVQFSSQECGVSLVEEIGRVLRVNGVRPEDPRPEAQKVYDRWLAQVREEDRLTIIGVGVLQFKNFKLDEAFDRRLNPQGHEAVRVRAPRRFDVVLWIGVAAIVCVAGFTAWWWLGEREMRQEIRSAVADRAAERRDAAVRTDADSLAATSAGTDSTTGIASLESVVPASGSEQSAVQGPAEQAPATASQSVQTPAATSQTPAASQSAAASQTTVRSDSRPTPEAGPSRLVSGQNYVVMGVFSSERNARRAAAEASAKEPAVTCGIYRFGSKFMVSPFESDDAEACRLYIRAHEERFPGMWTYTAR